MNIGKSPINFKGSYIAVKDDDQAGKKMTFTNDLKVLKKAQQRVQNGNITNPSSYYDGSNECTTCTIDDKITITTSTADNNKSKIAISVKDSDKTVKNLSISQDGDSDASQTELARAIENFVVSFKRKVGVAIQKAFNNSVIELLTKK